MNITRGRIPCGQKVVIYGVPGIGKTTLAAQFPNAVFIDTEGSTRSFDVARFDPPTSWEMVKSEAQYVLDHPEGIGTLVIDTADWAAKLCNQAICAKAGKVGIEDFGYGNGYTYAAEEYGRLLDILDRITLQRGIHVVITAHSVLKHVEQPDQFGKYDQWELKCDPKLAALTKEWADMILFCNYKIMVVATDKDGKKGKGQGGQRTMYTSTRPAFVAKNRYGLPDELPMDFAQIAPIFTPAVAAVSSTQDAPPTSPTAHQEETLSVEAPPLVPADDDSVIEMNPLTGENMLEGIPAPVVDLMQADKIQAAELRLCIDARLPGCFPDNMPFQNFDPNFWGGWVLPNWDAIVDWVKKDREALPF